MTYQDGERRAPTPSNRAGGTNWGIYPTHFVNGGRDLALEIKRDPLKEEVYPFFRNVIRARLQASVTAAYYEDFQKVPGRDYDPDALINTPGYVGRVNENHQRAVSNRERWEIKARSLFEIRPELEEPYQEVEGRFNRLVIVGLMDMKDEGFDPGNPIFHNTVGGALIDLVNFNLGGVYLEPEN